MINNDTVRLMVKSIEDLQTELMLATSILSEVQTVGDTTWAIPNGNLTPAQVEYLQEFQ